ncbi:MAG TPA: tetratricopeptide repeat protein [Ktedonobacterales bacterium]
MNRMMNRGGPGSQGVIPGGPLGKARYAMALGRPDEAERIARKRLERSPDDAAARVLLAQALLQMRQVDEAIAEARRATRDASTNADAHMTLSAALLQKGRFRVPAEAETAAKRAVQLQPKLARARVQLAEVLAANNDNVGALLAAEEAIKLEPRGPSGYFIKALALMRQKDYNGAVQAADSAIRFDREKQLPQAEYVRANALVEVKRYDEALTALSASERANPLLGGPQTQSLRGRIYFKQRKFGESYRTHLEAQRAAGRGNLTAPPLAAMNMVFLGLFGERGPYFLLTFVLVIVLLIIYAISLIPVAGQWIAAGLVIAAILVLAFASVRQLQGRILPENRALWVTTLPAIVAAFIIGAGATIAIERLIVGFFSHNPPLFTPTTVTIAGVVGAALAALAAYGWPMIVGRYGGDRGATAA